VIATTLAEAGLPADPLLAASQDPAVKQALVANATAAVDQGVFGAPTFFVGEAMYFGKDRLRDVEEAILAAT
jgi:2-hydroxychromene-2-carboxylate isomerase